MKPTKLIGFRRCGRQKGLAPGRYSVRNEPRGVNWFAVKRGRLQYRGRISKRPFTEWCATKDGAGAIARVAAGMRFSFIGRARAARRRMWQELDAASRAEGFTSTVAAESGHFMQAMADVCYADALPRTFVSQRRLVLAPRTLITGRARAGAFTRLMEIPALAGVDEAVRTFLIDRVVIEMDAAVRQASPAPRKPVLANDGWVCVGVQLGTMWADPIWAGPYGAGHLFMYDLPERLLRRDYKALDDAIEQMSGDVSMLSRTARDAMLRAATLRRV
jgi:hypothetical protein